MNTKAFLSLSASLGGLLLVNQPGFAAGSLTPPGPPAPMMKTLEEIEPRTPIASVPFTITSPGSYYLTGNLTGSNGIIVASSNVKIDLDGFALLGGSNSSAGISLSGAVTNLTIANGSISGWGWSGIDVYQSGSGSAVNLLIERLTISGNAGYGIESSGNSLIRDCVFLGNTLDGVYCQNGKVASCVSKGNRHGIAIGFGTVSGCQVENNRLNGIYVAGPGSTGCLVADNNCVGNNTSNDPNSAGIYLDGSNNRIDGNHVANSGHAGIQVDVTYVNNVVVKNSVSGNGANNYINPGNNDFGPVGTAAAAASAWANVSH